MISKHSIIRYLQKYKYSIILVFVLFILAFLFRASIKEVDIKSVFWAFINTVLLTSTLVVFSKTILRIPFIILFSLLATFEVGLFYIYRNPLNYGIVASIFATNTDEAGDIIKMILPVSIVTLFISLFLLSKASAELRQLSRKALIASVITFFVLFFIIPSISISIQTTENKDEVNKLHEKTTLPVTKLYQKLYTKYPFIWGDILISSSFLEQTRMFNNDSNKNKLLLSGITYEGNSQIDRFILVIGESATYHNFSLYGYPIKTTPFLDSLSIHNELLHKYDKVISPASYTIEALKISLSFASPINLAPFYDNKNIINIANDAGYKTIWLSSHSKHNNLDSYISTIAVNSNETFFQDLGSDDLGLLSPLKSVLKRKEKQFIVLHLIGSHTPYQKRYDKIDEEALKDVREYTDYDRSIHHTDRVLSGIYNEIKNKEENIVILYYSDHGEIINKGHAILNKYKVQYQVPLVIMQNKPIFDPNTIIEKYYNKNSGILNTSSNAYIISEILGYEISDSLINKARIEGEYVSQPDEKRIKYNQVID